MLPDVLSSLSRHIANLGTVVVRVPTLCCIQSGMSLGLCVMSGFLRVTSDVLMSGCVRLPNVSGCLHTLFRLCASYALKINRCVAKDGCETRESVMGYIIRRIFGVCGITNLQYALAFAVKVNAPTQFLFGQCSITVAPARL